MEAHRLMAMSSSGLVLAAVVVFGSGFVLARAGPPYGTLLFNVHKLVALAAVVVIGLMVRRANQAGALAPWQWASVWAAGLAVLATIAAGGAVSASERTPSWVRGFHRYTSWLAAALSAAAVYLAAALVLFLPAPALAAGQAAQGAPAQTLELLQTIDRPIDGCAAFVYRTEAAANDDLILMTDDLGDHVTRAWVNLGHGDIELKKVSYREDEKNLAFVFEGGGIEVGFDGTVTVPASETQEYSVLRGSLTVTRGSRTETRVAYVHSGC
jgi:hypothetical protein